MSKKVYQAFHGGWRSSEECAIALQAAESMHQRLGVDIAIMADLRTMPLHLVDLEAETPLEIIKAPRRNL